MGRLSAVFSEGTAKTILRLCSGHDDEPVADKTETKSMLAAVCSLLPPLSLPCLARCLSHSSFVEVIRSGKKYGEG